MKAARLLKHDKPQDGEKLAILQREISVGIKAATSGRFSKKNISGILAEVMLDSRTNIIEVENNIGALTGSRICNVQ